MSLSERNTAVAPRVTPARLRKAVADLALLTQKFMHGQLCSFADLTSVLQLIQRAQVKARLREAVADLLRGRISLCAICPTTPELMNCLVKDVTRLPDEDLMTTLKAREPPI